MRLKFAHGRWVMAALFLGYWLWVAGTGPAGSMAGRLKRLGVPAGHPPLMDLYLFPAARHELGTGGDPYVSNPADPQRRPYNYPAVWLWFMRFPMEERAIFWVGALQVALALGAFWVFLGPASMGVGIYAGVLLCTPGFELGVERGNTDLIIFFLLALAILGAASARPWARHTSRILWGGAAVLKLYPAVTLPALWGGGRQKWRSYLLPAAGFAGYLVCVGPEIAAIIRNTAGGWVVSYGARVAPPVLAHYLATRHAIAADVAMLDRVATAAAVSLIGVMVWLGFRADPAVWVAKSKLHLLGFRVGALIYVATFVAGSSFDYRLVFLLLTVPQLWEWAATFRGRAALASLGLLLVTMGVNYLSAGWPGFLANQAAAWALLAVLTWLVTASYPGRSRESPDASPRGRGAA